MSEINVGVGITIADAVAETGIDEDDIVDLSDQLRPSCIHQQKLLSEELTGPHRTGQCVDQRAKKNNRNGRLVGLIGWRQRGDNVLHAFTRR